MQNILESKFTASALVGDVTQSWCCLPDCIQLASQLMASSDHIRRFMPYQTAAVFSCCVKAAWCHTPDVHTQISAMWQMEGPMQTEKHVGCCNACAESDANGPGRHRAEEGQWFRLHGPSKTASPSDAGIIKIAVAVVDADVRRTMYLQPLLSQDKFTGMPLILHGCCCFPCPRC